MVVVVWDVRMYVLRVGYWNRLGVRIPRMRGRCSLGNGCDITSLSTPFSFFSLSPCGWFTTRNKNADQSLHATLCL